MDAERTDVSTREAERNVLELFDMEKRRIGQDLHDGIGQQLTGIHLMSKTLERRLHDQHSSEADFARSIANLVDETIQQVRRVVAGMAPPEVENQDAAAALNQLCRRIEDIHQIECLFCNRLTTMITDTAVIKNLYFIVTEAVHNAIRHGRADQVKVVLSNSELLISNNGSFDGKNFTGQPGIGLYSMQFRAQALNGWLRIQPEENHSISIICRFSMTDSRGRAE